MQENTPVRAPRPRPAPRPPAAPAQEGERRPSWRLITDGFTGAAPQPLPAGIGPDPPRVSGRGVTRRGRGGGGTRSRGRAGNTHSARHELVKSRAELLPAGPHGSAGAATERPGRSPGGKGHGRGPWQPSGSPRLLQLGGGFWAPSAPLQPRSLLPGLPRAPGGCGEPRRERTGTPKAPPSRSPAGEDRTVPRAAGGSGTARARPVTPECGKVQS